MAADCNALPASSDVIEVVRWLVRQDSTTGTAGERRALLAAANYTRGLLGAAGKVMVAPDDGAFVAVPAQVFEPVLLFACHVDTVPTGDVSVSWAHPPHAAHLEDGLIHGRGTSDMKAGMATALLAVVEGIRAGRPVALAVTTGEEAGCLGAPAAAGLLAPFHIGAVVIPESTDNLVALGHRGAYWLTVAESGVAAHGSTPEAGENAVLSLARSIGDLAGIPLRTHASLGAESVNVGAFHGGDVHNIVPARAEAAIDHRVVDPDVERLRGWWASRVDDVREDLVLDPVWTDASNEWVASLPAEVVDRPVPYFTDASVLIRHLAPGTPIVVWGPGDPSVVHSSSERVAVAKVEESLELFRVAIRGWGAKSRRGGDEA